MSGSTSKVYARALSGIEAPRITVETDIRGGLPGFSIVGLPETAVREARDRVKSAILNSGFDFPKTRVTVNLAPADIPKQGGRFDLSIAIGILCASRQLPTNTLKHFEILGELGLTGDVRSIRGGLSAAIDCAKRGCTLIVPATNFAEASLLKDNPVRGVAHLLEACRLVRHPGRLPELVDAQKRPSDQDLHSPKKRDFRLNQVRGQTLAKRALVIAAAGGHHLLMSGPPGCGKTMLANRFADLLPPPSRQETAAMVKIHSAAGFPELSRLFHRRPFRNPHHSASAAAIIGGGRPIQPGEASLAHLGVLFLDELPEFNRQVLESLREPLESREILITRVNSRIKFPAAFQLIAAMNPCPAGRSCNENSCVCSPEQKRRYSAKLSAPIMERIDLHVQLEALPETELLGTLPKLDEELLRQKISTARQIQKTRNTGRLNVELSSDQFNNICHLERAEEKLMLKCMSAFSLSVRACHRLMKVSRTIADLEGQDTISSVHLSEAMTFRPARQSAG